MSGSQGAAFAVWPMASSASATVEAVAWGMGGI